MVPTNDLHTHEAESAKETIMEYRVAAIEETLKEVKDSLSGINKSLNLLATLESKHSDTRDSVKRIHERLDYQGNALDRFGEILAAHQTLVSQHSKAINFMIACVVGSFITAIVTVIL